MTRKYSNSQLVRLFEPLKLELILKNLFTYTFLSTFTLLCTGLVSSVQAEELKIGFVNPVKVLEAAPQVQEANLRLEKEFEPRDKRIVATQKEIRRLEENLAKNEAIMGKDEVVELKRDIISKKRDIKREQEEFREDYNIRRSEELDKLQKKIYKTIEALAEEDGYDLIVSDGVIWASKRVDITEKVLVRLRKNSK